MDAADAVSKQRADRVWASEEELIESTYQGRPPHLGDLAGVVQALAVGLASRPKSLRRIRVLADHYDIRLLEDYVGPNQD